MNGHCCSCRYSGPMRPVGTRGYICGGCHRYVVPCRACRERAEQHQEQAEEVPKPAKRPLGERVGAIVARITRRAPDEWMDEPIEVDGLGDPEPPAGPAAAELEQAINTAKVRAHLAKTKETVRR